LLQAAVVLGHCGRAHLGRLPPSPDDLISEFGEVVLDVLPSDPGCARWQSLGIQERTNLVATLT
jgi:hypothetical protein